MGQSVCKCCNCTSSQDAKRRSTKIYPQRPLSVDCVWTQGSSLPSSIHRRAYISSDSDFHSMETSMGEDDTYIKNSRDDTAFTAIITETFTGDSSDELPVFLKRLKDITVRIGTNSRMLVELECRSDFKVTWYRNDNQILANDEYKIINEGNIYALEFTCVSIQDNGHWTCSAESKKGRVTSSCYLQVIVPKSYKKPVFYEELEAVLTDEGTVSLQCKVVGVPTPVLRWFKDGSEIRAGDIFALVANSRDPISLGTYTCEASNCMGKVYSSSGVKVNSKSSLSPNVQEVYNVAPLGQTAIFTQELKNEKIKIGESFILSCKVAVPPWPKAIKWQNPQEEYVDVNNPRYKDLADGLGGYMLEIISSEECDKGTWKCMAISQDNSTAVSSCDVQLTIPKNYRKPYFVEKLKAVLTEDGLVSFECKVVGYPTPHLSWFKDGSELKAGDIYQLTGVSSLGSYLCIAKNCMGEARSDAELTIDDIKQQLSHEETMLLSAIRQPPKFMKKLVSSESPINAPFKFTVQVQMPPCPKLSWYRDDHKLEIDGKKYSQMNETQGVFHLNVLKLEFEDQAEWKCVASNEFGRTECSSFLKLIIPKHFKKPKFLENLRAVLTENGIVNLECKVIGVPQPTLKWFKDGVELNPGDIHKIMSGQDGTCCLGLYTCEAHNCMGSVTSSASIHGIEDATPVKPKLRKLSLSTINEEDTFRTADDEQSLPIDQPHELSYSFDGKEISVSYYDTPDLTQEEAIQIIEMYADQLSEHISEHNVLELPPLRIVKETSTASNILMEGVVIDIVPEYFTVAEDDLRTEAGIEDISVIEDTLFSSQSSARLRLNSDSRKSTLDDKNYEIQSVSDSIQSPDLYYSLSESKKDDFSLPISPISRMSVEPDTETYISAKSNQMDRKSSIKNTKIFLQDSPDRPQSAAGQSHTSEETGEIPDDDSILRHNLQFLTVLLSNNLTDIQQRLCYIEREMFLNSLKQQPEIDESSFKEIGGLIQSVQGLRTFFLSFKHKKNGDFPYTFIDLNHISQELHANINAIHKNLMDNPNLANQKNSIKIVYQIGETLVNVLDLIGDVIKLDTFELCKSNVTQTEKQKLINMVLDTRDELNELVIVTQDLFIDAQENATVDEPDTRQTVDTVDEIALRLETDEILTEQSYKTSNLEKTSLDQEEPTKTINTETKEITSNFEKTSFDQEEPTKTINTETKEITSNFEKTSFDEEEPTKTINTETKESTSNLEKTSLELYTQEQPTKTISSEIQGTEEPTIKEETTEEKRIIEKQLVEIEIGIGKKKDQLIHEMFSHLEEKLNDTLFDIELVKPLFETISEIKSPEISLAEIFENKTVKDLLVNILNVEKEIVDNKLKEIRLIELDETDSNKLSQFENNKIVLKNELKKLSDLQGTLSKQSIPEKDIATRDVIKNLISLEWLELKQGEFQSHLDMIKQKQEKLTENLNKEVNQKSSELVKSTKAPASIEVEAIKGHELEYLNNLIDLNEIQNHYSTITEEHLSNLAEDLLTNINDETYLAELKIEQDHLQVKLKQAKLKQTLNVPNVEQMNDLEDQIMDLKIKEISLELINNLKSQTKQSTGDICKTIIWELPQILEERKQNIILQLESNTEDFMKQLKQEFLEIAELKVYVDSQPKESNIGLINQFKTLSELDNEERKLSNKLEEISQEKNLLESTDQSPQKLKQLIENEKAVQQQISNVKVIKAMEEELKILSECEDIILNPSQILDAKHKHIINRISMVKQILDQKVLNLSELKSYTAFLSEHNLQEIVQFVSANIKNPSFETDLVNEEIYLDNQANEIKTKIALVESSFEDSEHSMTNTDKEKKLNQLQENYKHVITKLMNNQISKLALENLKSTTQFGTSPSLPIIELIDEKHNTLKAQLDEINTLVSPRGAVSSHDLSNEEKLIILGKLQTHFASMSKIERTDFLKEISANFNDTNFSKLLNKEIEKLTTEIHDINMQKASVLNSSQSETELPQQSEQLGKEMKKLETNENILETKLLFAKIKQLAVAKLCELKDSQEDISEELENIENMIPSLLQEQEILIKGEIDKLKKSLHEIQPEFFPESKEKIEKQFAKEHLLEVEESRVGSLLTTRQDELCIQLDNLVEEHGNLNILNSHFTTIVQNQIPDIVEELVSNYKDKGSNYSNLLDLEEMQLKDKINDLKLQKYNIELMADTTLYQAEPNNSEKIDSLNAQISLHEGKLLTSQIKKLAFAKVSNTTTIQSEKLEDIFENALLCIPNILEEKITLLQSTAKTTAEVINLDATTKVEIKNLDDENKTGAVKPKKLDTSGVKSLENLEKLIKYVTSITENEITEIVDDLTSNAKDVNYADELQSNEVQLKGKINYLSKWQQYNLEKLSTIPLEEVDDMAQKESILEKVNTLQQEIVLNEKKLLNTQVKIMALAKVESIVDKSKPLEDLFHDALLTIPTLVEEEKKLIQIASQAVLNTPDTEFMPVSEELHADVKPLETEKQKEHLVELKEQTVISMSQAVTTVQDVKLIKPFEESDTTRKSSILESQVKEESENLKDHEDKLKEHVSNYEKNTITKVVEELTIKGRDNNYSEQLNSEERLLKERIKDLKWQRYNLEKSSSMFSEKVNQDRLDTIDTLEQEILQTERKLLDTQVKKMVLEKVSENIDQVENLRDLYQNALLSLSNETENKQELIQGNDVETKKSITSSESKQELVQSIIEMIDIPSATPEDTREMIQPTDEIEKMVSIPTISLESKPELVERTKENETMEGIPIVSPNATPSLIEKLEIVSSSENKENDKNKVKESITQEETKKTDTEKLQNISKLKEHFATVTRNEIDEIVEELITENKDCDYAERLDAQEEKLKCRINDLKWQQSYLIRLSRVPSEEFDDVKDKGDIVKKVKGLEKEISSNEDKLLDNQIKKLALAEITNIKDTSENIKDLFHDALLNIPSKLQEEENLIEKAITSVKRSESPKTEVLSTQPEEVESVKESKVCDKPESNILETNKSSAEETIAAKISDSAIEGSVTTSESSDNVKIISKLKEHYATVGNSEISEIINELTSNSKNDNYAKELNSDEAQLKAKINDLKWQRYNLEKLSISAIDLEQTDDLTEKETMLEKARTVDEQIFLNEVNLLNNQIKKLALAKITEMNYKTEILEDLYEDALLSFPEILLEQEKVLESSTQIYTESSHLLETKKLVEPADLKEKVPELENIKILKEHFATLTESHITEIIEELADQITDDAYAKKIETEEIQLQTKINDLKWQRYNLEQISNIPLEQTNNKLEEEKVVSEKANIIEEELAQNKVKLLDNQIKQMAIAEVVKMDDHSGNIKALVENVLLAIPNVLLEEEHLILQNEATSLEVVEASSQFKSVEEKLIEDSQDESKDKPKKTPESSEPTTQTIKPVEDIETEVVEIELENELDKNINSKLKEYCDHITEKEVTEIAKELSLNATDNTYQKQLNSDESKLKAKLNDLKWQRYNLERLSNIAMEQVENIPDNETILEQLHTLVQEIYLSEANLLKVQIKKLALAKVAEITDQSESLEDLFEDCLLHMSSILEEKESQLHLATESKITSIENREDDIADDLNIKQEDARKLSTEEITPLDQKLENINKLKEYLTSVTQNEVTEIIEELKSHSQSPDYAKELDADEIQLKASIDDLKLQKCNLEQECNIVFEKTDNIELEDLLLEKANVLEHQILQNESKLCNTQVKKMALAKVTEVSDISENIEDLIEDVVLSIPAILQEEEQMIRSEVKIEELKILENKTKEQTISIHEPVSEDSLKRIIESEKTMTLEEIKKLKLHYARISSGKISEFVKEWRSDNDEIIYANRLIAEEMQLIGAMNEINSDKVLLESISNLSLNESINPEDLEYKRNLEEIAILEQEQLLLESRLGDNRIKQIAVAHVSQEHNAEDKVIFFESILLNIEHILSEKENEMSTTCALIKKALTTDEGDTAKDDTIKKDQDKLEDKVVADKLENKIKDKGQKVGDGEVEIEITKPSETKIEESNLEKDIIKPKDVKSDENVDVKQSSSEKVSQSQEKDLETNTENKETDEKSLDVAVETHLNDSKKEKESTSKEHTQIDNENKKEKPETTETPTIMPAEKMAIQLEETKKVVDENEKQKPLDKLFEEKLSNLQEVSTDLELKVNKDEKLDDSKKELLPEEVKPVKLESAESRDNDLKKKIDTKSVSEITHESPEEKIEDKPFENIETAKLPTEPKTEEMLIEKDKIIESQTKQKGEKIIEILTESESPDNNVGLESEKLVVDLKKKIVEDNKLKDKSLVEKAERMQEMSTETPSANLNEMKADKLDVGKPVDDIVNEKYEEDGKDDSIVQKQSNETPSSLQKELPSKNLDKNKSEILEKEHKEEPSEDQVVEVVEKLREDEKRKDEKLKEVPKEVILDESGKDDKLSEEKSTKKINKENKDKTESKSRKDEKDTKSTTKISGTEEQRVAKSDEISLTHPEQLTKDSIIQNKEEELSIKPITKEKVQNTKVTLQKSIEKIEEEIQGTSTENSIDESKKVENDKVVDEKSSENILGEKKQIDDKSKSKARTEEIEVETNKPKVEQKEEKDDKLDVNKAQVSKTNKEESQDKLEMKEEKLLELPTKASNAGLENGESDKLDNEKSAKKILDQQQDDKDKTKPKKRKGSKEMESTTLSSKQKEDKDNKLDESKVSESQPGSETIELREDKIQEKPIEKKEEKLQEVPIKTSNESEKGEPDKLDDEISIKKIMGDKKITEDESKSIVKKESKDIESITTILSTDQKTDTLIGNKDTGSLPNKELSEPREEKSQEKSIEKKEEKLQEVPTKASNELEKGEPDKLDDEKSVQKMVGVKKATKSKSIENKDTNDIESSKTTLSTEQKTYNDDKLVENKDPDSLPNKESNEGREEEKPIEKEEEKLQKVLSKTLNDNSEKEKPVKLDDRTSDRETVDEKKEAMDETKSEEKKDSKEIELITNTLIIKQKEDTDDKETIKRKEEKLQDKPTEKIEEKLQEVLIEVPNAELEKKKLDKLEDNKTNKNENKEGKDETKSIEKKDSNNIELSIDKLEKTKQKENKGDAGDESKDLVSQIGKEIIESIEEKPQEKPIEKTEIILQEVPTEALNAELKSKKDAKLDDGKSSKELVVEKKVTKDEAISIEKKLSEDINSGDLESHPDKDISEHRENSQEKPIVKKEEKLQEMPTKASTTELDKDDGKSAKNIVDEKKETKDTTKSKKRKDSKNVELTTNTEQRVENDDKLIERKIVELQPNKETIECTEEKSQEKSIEINREPLEKVPTETDNSELENKVDDKLDDEKSSKKLADKKKTAKDETKPLQRKDSKVIELSTNTLSTEQKEDNDDKKSENKDLRSLSTKEERKDDRTQEAPIEKQVKKVKEVSETLNGEFEEGKSDKLDDRKSVKKTVDEKKESKDKSKSKKRKDSKDVELVTNTEHKEVKGDTSKVLGSKTDIETIEHREEKLQDNQIEKKEAILQEISTKASNAESETRNNDISCDEKSEVKTKKIAQDSEQATNATIEQKDVTEVETKVVTPKKDKDKKIETNDEKLQEIPNAELKKAKDEKLDDGKSQKIIADENKVTTEDSKTIKDNKLDQEKRKEPTIDEKKEVEDKTKQKVGAENKGLSTEAIDIDKEEKLDTIKSLEKPDIQKNDKSNDEKGTEKMDKKKEVTDKIKTKDSKKVEKESNDKLNSEKKKLDKIDKSNKMDETKLPVETTVISSENQESNSLLGEDSSKENKAEKQGEENEKREQGKITENKLDKMENKSSESKITPETNHSDRVEVTEKIKSDQEVSKKIVQVLSNDKNKVQNTKDDKVKEIKSDHKKSIKKTKSLKKEGEEQKDIESIKLENQILEKQMKPEKLETTDENLIAREKGTKLDDETIDRKKKKEIKTPIGVGKSTMAVEVVDKKLNVRKMENLDIDTKKNIVTDTTSTNRLEILDKKRFDKDEKTDKTTSRDNNEQQGFRKSRYTETLKTKLNTDNTELLGRKSVDVQRSKTFGAVPKRLEHIKDVHTLKTYTHDKDISYTRASPYNKYENIIKEKELSMSFKNADEVKKGYKAIISDYQMGTEMLKQEKQLLSSLADFSPFITTPNIHLTKNYVEPLLIPRQKPRNINTYICSYERTDNFHQALRDTRKTHDRIRSLVTLSESVTNSLISTNAITYNDYEQNRKQKSIVHGIVTIQYSRYRPSINLDYYRGYNRISQIERIMNFKPYYDQFKLPVMYAIYKSKIDRSYVYPRRYEVTLYYGFLRRQETIVREYNRLKYGYNSRIIQHDADESYNLSAVRFKCYENCHSYEYCPHKPLDTTKGKLVLGQKGYMEVCPIKSQYRSVKWRSPDSDKYLQGKAETDTVTTKTRSSLVFVSVKPKNTANTSHNKVQSKALVLDSDVPKYSRYYPRVQRPSSIFITQPDSLISVAPGQDITVTFEINQDSNAKVNWTKRSMDVTKNPRFRCENFGTVTKYILKNSNFDDMGTYCLSAESNYETSKTFVTVTVDSNSIYKNTTYYKLLKKKNLPIVGSMRIMPTHSKLQEMQGSLSTYKSGTCYSISPPVFYTYPHNTVVEIGESARFQVTIGGFPSPSVTWKKDGINIGCNSRIRIIEKFNTKMLEIVSTIAEDAGIYTVTIQNEGGRLSTTAKLDLIAIKKKSYSLNKNY